MSLGFTAGKAFNEFTHGVRKANYETGYDRHKELLKQKLEKSLIRASTISVDAEWNGLVKMKVGEVRLNFSLKELNGIGATFDTYTVRIICVHDYLLKNIQEERVGNFHFDNPVIVSPFQTERIIITGNNWVRKNINSMNRLASKEDINLQLELKGEDQNGNKLTIRATSGMI